MRKQRIRTFLHGDVKSDNTWRQRRTKQCNLFHRRTCNKSTHQKNRKQKGSTQEFTRVGERRRWVDYLQKRTIKTKFSKRKQKRIIEWGTETKYNFTTPKERIDKHIHDKKIPMYHNNKKKRKTPSSPRSIITVIEQTNHVTLQVNDPNTI